MAAMSQDFGPGPGTGAGPTEGTRRRLHAERPFLPAWRPPTLTRGKVVHSPRHRAEGKRNTPASYARSPGVTVRRRGRRRTGDTDRRHRLRVLGTEPGPQLLGHPRMSGLRR